MDRENRDGELLPPRRIRPIEKRSFRIFCISCPPCVWISCCAIWTVILILAIILGSIAYANINQCRKLNVDNISPSVMTYDPNIFSEVKIESFGNYLKGQVFVSQSNSTNSKNATVRIQVAGIGKQGATVQTLSSNSQYSITLTQSGFGSPFEFLAYLTLPPKCSDARVHIIFPQTSQSSNSNGNKDQTVTVATLRSITSNNMDVTLQQNEVPFYDQIFNVTTIKSNIIVENFTANSIMLSSNIGEISGTIGGIYSQLKAASFKGVIQLSVDLTSRLNSFAQYVKTQQQPKIEVETESGNDSTFSGNFSATTDKGHIQPLNTQNINTQTDTQVSGTVPGNLNANLTVVTYKGDINLEF
ncbi:8921_t:CDS:2 [Ambispora gerdemannii]|uniref:8921_t:CDS:1 n=1 Tax=Ambispora gerdemannii TaxID=144530 RepID=A0A9N9GT98_9GLOM|nr:8921_t:CDS:2 [Ambispora gerdemannii]